MLSSKRMAASTSSEIFILRRISHLSSVIAITTFWRSSRPCRPRFLAWSTDEIWNLELVESLQDRYSREVAEEDPLPKLGACEMN